MKKTIMMLLVALALDCAAQIPVEVVNLRAPNTPATVADTITANPGDIIFDEDNKQFQFYDGTTTGGIVLNADPDGEVYVPFTTNYTASGSALLAATTNMSDYAQAAGTVATIYLKYGIGQSPAEAYTLSTPLEFDGYYDLVCRDAFGSPLNAYSSYYCNAWGCYSAASMHFAFLKRNAGQTNIVARFSADVSNNSYPVIKGVAFLGDITNAVNATSYSFDTCLFKGKWYGADEPPTGSKAAYGCNFTRSSFGSGFSTASNSGNDDKGYFDSCAFSDCVIDGYFDTQNTYFERCNFVNGGIKAYYNASTIGGKLSGYFTDCRFGAANPFDASLLGSTANDKVSVTATRCTFENASVTGWFSGTTLTANAVRFYNCTGIWSGMTNTLAVIVNCTDESGNAIPNQ